MPRRLHLLLFILCLGYWVPSHGIPAATISDSSRSTAYYDTLVAHFERRIDACKNCPDTLLGRLYLNLASAYQYELRVTDCYEAMQTAEDYLVRAGNETLLAELHVSYGEYYRMTAQFGKSLAHLQTAKEIIDGGKVAKKTQARYYSRRAAVASEYEKDRKMTLYYSERALSLAKEMKNRSMVATALNEIAFMREQDGDTSAMPYYREAYQLMVKEGRLLDACDILSNMVAFYVRRKAYSSALQPALQGYALAREKNYDRALSGFLGHLIDIYRNTGNHQLAFKYLEEKTVSDSIVKEKVWGEMVYEMEKKYDLEKKEEQIGFQATQIKQERSNRNTVIVFLVLVSALLSVALFYFFRARRSNFQLQGLLRENQFLLGESNHRIKNNLQLISALANRELKKKGQVTDPNSLLAISAKIEAISTLHKQLYLTESKETIRLDTYLEELKANFLVFAEQQQVKMELAAAPIEVSIHSSTYIGLLCTELILNSLKHAFTEEAGNKLIRIVLKESEGNVFLSYADNGIGLKDKNSKLQLIDLISRQLRFQYSVDSEKGFYFETKNLAETPRA